MVCPPPKVKRGGGLGGEGVSERNRQKQPDGHPFHVSHVCPNLAVVLGKLSLAVPANHGGFANLAIADHNHLDLGCRQQQGVVGSGDR